MKKGIPWFRNPVFLVVFVVRLFLPFFIFSFPIVTVLLSYFVDMIDGDLLESFVGLKRKTYQKYDKLLDSWWLSFIMAYIYFNNIPYYGWFLWLFLYRMFGVLLVMINGSEWLLFVFPNVFETFFVIYLFFPQWFGLEVGSLRDPIPLFIIITVITLIREYWLHIANRDIFNLKKFLGK